LLLLGGLELAQDNCLFTAALLIYPRKLLFVHEGVLIGSSHTIASVTTVSINYLHYLVVKLCQMWIFQIIFACVAWLYRLNIDLI